MNIRYLEYLKQYLKRKQIVTLIAIAVIVVSAAFLVSRILQPQPEEVPLKIIRYKIEPKEFKATENATLHLDVMNKMANSTAKCDYYFETHNNVRVYLGIDPLPKSGNNYTHTKILDPKERSYLEFTVVASLDIGDNFRSYYVKVYIFANDALVGVGDVDFWVKRQ